MTQENQRNQNQAIKDGDVKKTIVNILVLTVLQEDTCYIKRLHQLVEEKNTAPITVTQRNIYASLTELCEKKYVKVSRKEVTDGRMRIYYEITKSGTRQQRMLCDAYLAYLDGLANAVRQLNLVMQ